MGRILTNLLLGVVIASGAALVGCEDEVARERTVDVENGEVTTEETIVRDRDGAIEIEKRTTEEEREDGRIETETEREVEVVPTPQQ